MVTRSVWNMALTRLLVIVLCVHLIHKGSSAAVMGVLIGLQVLLFVLDYLTREDAP